MDTHREGLRYYSGSYWGQVRCPVLTLEEYSKQKAAGSSQTELLPKRNHDNEDTIQGFSTDETLNFEQNKGANVICHGSPDFNRIHCLQPQIRSIPAKSRAAHNLKEDYGGSRYSAFANKHIWIPAVFTLVPQTQLASCCLFLAKEE